PEGQPLPVHVWKAGLRVQRQFWPAQEGGADKSPQPLAAVRIWETVPLEALYLGLATPAPKLLRLPHTNPGQPGSRLQAVFPRPLQAYMAEPATSPREQMLRGRVHEATQAVVQTREELTVQRDRLTTVDVADKLDKWCDAVIQAEADYIQSHKDPSSKVRL